MRHRCGAPLPEDTQARVRHNTCRKFVAIEGNRCHLHQGKLTVFSALMTEMLT